MDQNVPRMPPPYAYRALHLQPWTRWEHRKSGGYRTALYPAWVGVILAAPLIALAMAAVVYGILAWKSPLLMLISLLFAAVPVYGGWLIGTRRSTAQWEVHRARLGWKLHRDRGIFPPVVGVRLAVHSHASYPRQAQIWVQTAKADVPLPPCIFLGSTRLWAERLASAMDVSLDEQEVEGEPVSLVELVRKWNAGAARGSSPRKIARRGAPFP
jgi:hypothetical protein